MARFPGGEMTGYLRIHGHILLLRAIVHRHVDLTKRKLEQTKKNE